MGLTLDFRGLSWTNLTDEEMKKELGWVLQIEKSA